jgi:hypothetical protein
MNPKPTAVLALALLASGCLEANVKASRVCASEAGQAIPGVPASPGVPVSTPPVTVSIDLSGVLNDLDRAGVTGDVRMLDFGIASPSGADLYGIDSIAVRTLPSPTSPTLPPVPLDCSYQRPPGATRPITQVTAGCSSPNLFEYAKNQELVLEFTLTGTELPAADWTASVGACLSIEVTLDYTEL